MSKVSSRGKISEPSEARGKKWSDDDQPAPVVVVYNLGSLGVNLVDSPLHIKDGVLELAQNAQTSTRDDELALRKRDGMVKVNTTASAGAIAAIFSVPFPDPAP